MSRQKVAEVDRSVNAVGRTLAILEAFLERDGPLTLTDLEEETGLFKSVILRYMLSLESMNYVFKRPDGRYQLGSRVYQLGCKFESTLNLTEQVLPVLERLTQTTQESSSFYVREGDSRICMLRKDSPQHLRASIAPGTRLPMDDSATANALRAFESSAPISWTMSDCVFTTANKVNAVTASSPLTASMSVPVLRYGRSLAGALTVSGPAARFDPERPENKSLLLEAARNLTTLLGGS